jgi:hypothetical protein
MLADGPLRVTFAPFGFKLIYSEGQYKLTLPVEFGLDCSCNIGTVFIGTGMARQRCSKEEVFTIEKNIFAALDHLHIRYTNAR